MQRRELLFGSLATGLASRAFAAGAATRTLAGTGSPGYTNDGGKAEAAQINNPYGLTTGPDGALYVCEIGNHLIRRIDLRKGTISTVVGSGKKGYSGDGGPASQAVCNEPYEVRFDRAGNMFWVEMPNHVVRRMDKTTKTVTTVAGTGTPGFAGDGGPANRAQLNQPHSIAFDPQGRIMICDIRNHRVRRVDLKTGLIETFLGTGAQAETPNGAPLAGTPVNGPRAIDLDPKGNLYLVLREGNKVFRIDPNAGVFHHLAGTGQKGYTGDGGPATAAQLNGPKGIAWSPEGSAVIADTENHAIRRIDLKTGVITTLIGTGTRGDGPDGPPLQCRTSRPHGVFIDRAANLYVGDSEAHRVRLLRLR
jgi:DNA-binding beta-propeller fold protein YncE